VEVIPHILLGSDMEKHTPGPWFAIQNAYYWEIRTKGEQYGGDQIGDACASRNINDGANAESNARLIAAAPELLAACKAAMRILALWGGNDCPEDSHLFEENRALFMMQNAFEIAIAKAEGCHQTFDCNAGDHSDACPAAK